MICFLFSFNTHSINLNINNKINLIKKTNNNQRTKTKHANKKLLHFSQIKNINKMNQYQNITFQILKF